MKTNDAVKIIWSDRYADHATGSHPERPERIGAIKQALEEAGLFNCRLVVEPLAATRGSVELVHDARLVDLIRRVAESGGGWLDPDTYVSPASYDVALLAVGGVTHALQRALDDGPAFAIVRPPGHHAEPGRSMGFCLFNNVAVAVEQIRHERAIERVAILDWDVHHGNGTQAAFWENPDVLYISLHQSPFYPGTGAATEVGGWAAKGTTINIPLPPRSDDAVYRKAFSDVVLPSMRVFEPELIVVSAGYDAHIDDPLANMRVTTDGFSWMASEVAGLALETCDGHLALALEGGYNLQSLGPLVVATIEGINARFGSGESR